MLTGSLVHRPHGVELDLGRAADPDREHELELWLDERCLLHFPVAEPEHPEPLVRESAHPDGRVESEIRYAIRLVALDHDGDVRLEPLDQRPLRTDASGTVPDDEPHIIRPIPT